MVAVCRPARLQVYRAFISCQHATLLLACYVVARGDAEAEERASAKAAEWPDGFLKQLQTFCPATIEELKRHDLWQLSRLTIQELTEVLEDESQRTQIHANVVGVIVQRCAIKTLVNERKGLCED